jgi:maltose alpha-D-glucosyltransferase/alpha-amylase
VNVESQRSDPTSLLHTIRRMILARKAHPELAMSALVWWDDLPKEALCFWRGGESGRFLALHNLSAQPMTITLPESAVFNDALSETEIKLEGSVELPPYGYRWLMLV